LTEMDSLYEKIVDDVKSYAWNPAVLGRIP
jgi:hypothetical protein